MVIVKKYANRRLYTTDESRYVSLAELAEKIRGGTDVKVVDARSGEDLTQATLTQIVIEHRGAGKLLSVRLLTQMIRLGDDAFSEFVSQFMTDGMEMYLQLRSGIGRVAGMYPGGGYSPASFPPNPFMGAKNPWSAWFERWRRPAPPAPAASAPPPEPEPEPPVEPEEAPRDPEISALRRELDELKSFIKDALSKGE